MFDRLQGISNKQASTTEILISRSYGCNMFLTCVGVRSGTDPRRDGMTKYEPLL